MKTRPRRRKWLLAAAAAAVLLPLAVLVLLAPVLLDSQVVKTAIRQRIEDMPELTVGERYVVLLEAERTPRLTSPFVGFNQGLYRVVGTSRATAVVRDRLGKPLAASGGATRAAPGDPSLDEFLDGLRAARAK